MDSPNANPVPEPVNAIRSNRKSLHPQTVATRSSRPDRRQPLSRIHETQHAALPERNRSGRRPREPYNSSASNVFPWLRSPVSSPKRNQRARCSEVPCVNDSGTT